MKIEKLSPAFKDYLWGGTKLRDVYGKKCDYEKVAESWELSTHPAGQSVIDGGEYDGLKFGEYLEKVGAKALGVNGAKFKEFPVLIKFIDAKQPLSVLASGMKMYPQKLKNVVVTDKDETLNCEEVKAAVKQVEAELGENGRVVLRKSGTEPLLRVMVEATSDDLCEEKVDYIIDAMRKCGKLIRVK